MAFGFPLMLTDLDKKRVRDSWRLVVPIKETAADLFYKRLFELKPAYQSLFSGDMASQKRKLITMLAFIVKSLDWPQAAWTEDIDEADDLFLVVLALGRRHRDLYRVPDESYDVVREALLWTLDYALGDAFDPELRTAWARVYELVANVMRIGKAAVDLGTKVEAPDWEAM